MTPKNQNKFSKKKKTKMAPKNQNTFLHYTTDLQATPRKHYHNVKEPYLKANIDNDDNALSRKRMHW